MLLTESESVAASQGLTLSFVSLSALFGGIVFVGTVLTGRNVSETNPTQEFSVLGVVLSKVTRVATSEGSSLSLSIQWPTIALVFVLPALIVLGIYLSRRRSAR